MIESMWQWRPQCLGKFTRTAKIENGPGRITARVARGNGISARSARGNLQVCLYVNGSRIKSSQRKELSHGNYRMDDQIRID